MQQLLSPISMEMHKIQQSSSTGNNSPGSSYGRRMPGTSCARFSYVMVVDVWLPEGHPVYMLVKLIEACLYLPVVI